jgi:putative ABC transport system substrate-binding protein
MSQPPFIRIRAYAILRLLVCAVVSLCPFLVHAEVVGILFPEVREPYRQVYRNIIDGVETEYKRKAEQFQLSPTSSPEAVRRWLEEKKITALVVLGNECLAHVPQNAELAVVVGGTLLKPSSESLAGITLNPSPLLLFEGLLAIRPAVANIHVVFEEDYNGWVVAEAGLAAEQLGIRLHRHPVANMREAAAVYRQVQKTMDRRTSALWLPLGGPSREKTILQEILETAWKHDQIIFSSNLAEVRRGVLFALYPDNHRMGRELAAMLKDISPENRKNNTRFLSSVYEAINLRTAEHIGLRLHKEELKEFEFVYPPQ